MKKILTLMIIVLSFPIYSQTIYQTIRGKVIDKDSKQTLPGASVILKDTSPIVGTITNQDGEYTLQNVPVGRQSLSVSFIGYHTVDVNNILVLSGKESVINIELTEKVENLQTVVIKAYEQDGKAMNEMAPVSARSFSVEQTERFAGSLGDPARMVGNYAGVVMQNDSRNDIIIRGNSPVGVIWRLDDIEIPNPNHFGALGTTGGPVSMLNNNLLTNSDFFTGAFPAEFGNGISGAFDLRMRSGNNQKTEFTGQIGFNGFEFGVEGPFSKKSKASYIVNGRYSTLALVHKIGFGSGTGTGMAVPYYNDLTFKADVPTSKYGKFSVFGILGSSHIDLGADIMDTAATGYNLTGQHTVFGANQKVIGMSQLYFFNAKTRMKISLSGQNAGDKTVIDNYKIEENRIQEYYRSKNSQSKISLAGQLKSKINTKNNFSAGFNVTYNLIDFLDSVYVNTSNRFITLHNTDGNFLTYRLYAQYQHKLSDSFSLFAGLHGLDNSINHEFSVEPRAGLEWILSPSQSVSFGYGRHSQMQPSSVYFLQYTDTINNNSFQTNRSTKLTKADHLVLGYSIMPGKSIKIKAETYYQHIYNIPVSPGSPEFSMLNAGEFFNIPTTDSLQNIGKGRNYGIELTIEKFLKKGYYLLFTTSVFDSKYTGYDGKWRNTAFNSNYIFNLLAGYEVKVKSKTFLTFDVKSVYAGGKRYIPVDIEESIKHGEMKLNYVDAYTNKFDNYFRFDFRIGVKLNGKRISQEWAMDLQNLTGHHAKFQEGYDANKKVIYYNYQQGFYPMFLYRIQF